MAFLGKEVDYDSEITPAGSASGKAGRRQWKEQVPADIRYGYCTEFIIHSGKPEYTEETEQEFKALSGVNRRFDCGLCPMTVL